MRYGKLAAPGPGGALVIEVRPRSPYRLPRRRWPDGVARTRDGVYERFLHVDDAPVLIRAWEARRTGRVAIAAMPVPPAWLGVRALGGRSAGVDELEAALDCGRRALGVDDDLSEFHARFKRDPLLGPLIRRMPWLRPRRTAQHWEALAWAVTEQLIEAREAHVIQRRIVGRWGTSLRLPGRQAAAPGRPLCRSDRRPGSRRAGRLRPRAEACDRSDQGGPRGRLRPLRPRRPRRRPPARAISNIGPWTLQCLGLNGRGDLDSLPAGDLAYVKLVGRLAGLGRRATVAEIEEFYAPYAPYRGIAGLLTLSGLRHTVAQGAPLRYHPANPELEAA